MSEGQTVKEAVAALNDGILGIIEALGILNARLERVEAQVRQQLERPKP